MPYLLPKTEALMNAGNDKLSIFGDTGQPAAQNQGDAGLSGSSPVEQGGALNKQDSSMAVTPESGSQAQSQAKAPPPTGAGKASAIYQRNAPIQSGGIAQDISQGLGKASEALQNEANSYMTSATSPNYVMAEGDVLKGLRSGGEEFNKITSLMSKPKADQVAAYQQTTAIPTAASNLTTQAGIGQALRSKADERYSQGEEALDASLLARDKEFQQSRQTLQDRQNALAAQADDYRNSLQNKAQAAQEAKLAAAKTQLSEQAKKEMAAVKAQEAERAAKENAVRQLLLDPNQYEGGRYRKAEFNNTFLPKQQEIYRQVMANATPDQKFLAEQGRALAQRNLNPSERYFDYSKDFAPITQAVDPMAFYRANPLVTAEQEITPEEAAEFNRIYGLLGMTDVSQAGSVAPRSSWDSDSYRAALVNYIAQLPEIYQTPQITPVAGTSELPVAPPEGFDPNKPYRPDTRPKPISGNAGLGAGYANV